MIAKVSGFVLQKGVRMGIDCLAGFQGKGRGGEGVFREGEGGEENGERRRGGSHVCHPFFVWR